MLKFNSIAYAFNVSTNGTYCPLTCNLPSGGQSGAVEGVELFDAGYYTIVTGTGVTAGSISLAMWDYPGVWNTVTTPNSATGTAFTLIPTLGASATYKGSLGITGIVVFPCSGLRYIVAGLTGGNIASMQLTLTKR